MQYYNGRRDDSTGSIPIIYVANDTGGSQLERVTLERRTAPTNNNNTLGTWT